MIDPFQGEPKVFIDENGAYFDIRSGQPIMEQGFENDMLSDLFTHRDWSGNIFLESIGESTVGCDLEKKCEQPLNMNTFNDIRSEVLRTLNRYKKDRIVKSIEVEVTNPEVDNLLIIIVVVTKDNLLTRIKLARNGMNWLAQIERAA